jgi:hypothetical protein
MTASISAPRRFRVQARHPVELQGIGAPDGSAALAEVEAFAAEVVTLLDLVADPWCSSLLGIG